MTGPRDEPGHDASDELPRGPNGDALPDTWMHMARTTYNTPGATPREEIWRKIESAVLSPAAPPPPVVSARRRWPWAPLLAAASVALLLGLGVAQWSAEPEQTPAALGPPAPAGEAARRSSSTASPSMRYATARHLSDVDALLSLVQVDAGQARVDPGMGIRGRELLTQTRLLLDSPVAGEAPVREVLEDLELVLAQVALLADPGGTPDRLRSELQLIARGVADGGVRSRLRTVLPSFDHVPLAADD